MQKSKMALASLMLAVTAMLAVGCTKPDEPGNGGNGGNIGSGTYNGHKFVDLGLPSGTLWATCNVGADTPEGYGEYYSWGETTPKTHYSDDTYRYFRFVDGVYKVTKYCSDNLTILEAGDDAATVNWGDGWRTPTYNEWDELLAYCTQTWTTRNDVNGRLFTAPNGNSLFLPAAGSWYESLYYVGSDCYYWSSSLYTDHPYYAWYFSFYSGRYGMKHDNRYYGRSVRPVRSAAKN